MEQSIKPCVSIYHLEKLKKIRKTAYLVIILFGWVGIFFPYIAHADIFGNEIHDVYATITENVSETNSILRKAFSFCSTSPFDVINSLDKPQANVLTSIIAASKTTALVVAVLLLMVDFFRKSVAFEWSSRWENVLLFLLKIIVIKQVIQNADTIIASIYAGFNYINNKAIANMWHGAVWSFLPTGDTDVYTWTDTENIFGSMWDNGIIDGWTNFWNDVGADELETTYSYPVSKDAVRMFYPNATFPTDIDPTHLSLNDYPFANPTTRANFNPTVEKFLLQPYFWVMKAIAYLIFVIAAGRVFELGILTIFAPLPLATFASETSSDVARNYIKNYIATVIQIAVIIAMFMIYVALSATLATQYESVLIQFIGLITLGLGVMKSGAWSKKICGMG